MKEQSHSYGTRIRSRGFDSLGIHDFFPLVITAITIFHSVWSTFAYNRPNIAFAVNLVLYKSRCCYYYFHFAAGETDWRRLMILPESLSYQMREPGVFDSNHVLFRVYHAAQGLLNLCCLVLLRFWGNNERMKVSFSLRNTSGNKIRIMEALRMRCIL